jgi:TolA-binding protein
LPCPCGDFDRLVGLVVLHGSKCSDCGKSWEAFGANLGRIQTHEYAMMASLKEIVAVRFGLLATLTPLLLLCNTVQARPKPADVGAAEIPALEATLVAAGWTMTPERSASYNVGDIYSRSTNTPVAFKAKCFDAEPRENAYTSLEVVQAMKAGARVPLGIARFKAEGMEYKQLKFAEPYMTELADMDLVLKDKCQKFLASRKDLADLFVIKAVLSAEVKEQLCRSIDAAAGALGFGASAAAQQECVQASEGHVAVAYKTQEAASLVSMAAAPVATPTPIAAPLPMAVAVPSQATASVDFGGGGGGLGVAERLRQQRCNETAKVKGEQARAARLATAEQGAQSKARTAWSGQSTELEMCASLKRAERDGCIEAVNAWLGVARAMLVSIPAGVETIETECGTRQPVYEAVERTVVASDVKKAEVLLVKLQSAGSVSAGGGSGGSGSGAEEACAARREKRLGAVPDRYEVKARQARIESIEKLQDILRNKQNGGVPKEELLLRLADLYLKEAKANHSGSSQWLDKSIKLYRLILRDYPRSSRADTATFYLAQALQEDCKLDDAVKEFTKLVKTYPQSGYAADAYVMIGGYYFDSKPFTAVLAYQKATKYKDSPKYTFALYSLAWCYYNMGEHGQGIDTMGDLVRSTEHTFSRSDMKLHTAAVKALAQWKAKTGD